MNIMTSDTSAFDKGKQLGVYSIALGKEMYEVGKATGANFISSVGYGIHRWGENISDSKKIGEYEAEIRTLLAWEGVATGDSEEAKELRAQCIERIREIEMIELPLIMKDVELDKTKAKWDKMFENSEFWKAANEKSIIKYGDVTYEVVSGIANAIPTIAISTGASVLGSIVLGPVGGTMAATATASGFSYATGKGRYAEQGLNLLKSNSKSGITELYQDGEISEETYKMYSDIWSMTSTQMQDINLQYASGNMDESEYKRIKEIYEMDDNWTTYENFNKVAEYSRTGAQWESVQSAISYVLNYDKISSAIRVVSDTLTGVAEPLVMSNARAKLLDTTFEEAFEQSGGTVGVAISAVIAGGQSLVSEGFDAIKAKFKNWKLESEIDEFYSDIRSFVEDIELAGTSSGRLLSESSGTETLTNGNFVAENKEKAKELMLRYYGFLSNSGVTMQDIDDAFDGMYVFESRKAMCDYLISDGQKNPESINAFYDIGMGKVCIPPDASTKDIIHEVNHSLGYAVNPDGINGIKQFYRYNPINEALTERLACIMATESGNALDFGKTKYAKNAEYLDYIFVILKDAGYKDCNGAYFNNSASRNALCDALADLSGNPNFYDDLAGVMYEKAFYDRQFGEKYNLEKVAYYNGQIVEMIKILKENALKMKNN